MQLRQDIGFAYLGLLLFSALSLIYPIPVPVHMIVATALTIYIGSHNAIIQTKEPHSGVSETETMERQDVLMFPIIGSCVLFGLYCIFKLVPQILIMICIKTYFVLTGVYVIAKRIIQITILCINDQQFRQFKSIKRTLDLTPINVALRPVVAKYTQLASTLDQHVSPLLKKAETLLEPVMKMIGGDSKSEPKSAVEIAQEKAKSIQDGLTAAASPFKAESNDCLPPSLDLDGIDCIGYGIAIVITTLYLFTNHWFLSNIFGVCFSIQAIELLNLGSYMNGAILLSGLFVYDIFWVFGTDVMVTVAKNFDAPIKLLFPRADLPSAMLGLGDIVIPGIFIALMLRLDIYLNRPFAQLNSNSASSGPRQVQRYSSGGQKPTNSIDTVLAHIGNYSFVGIRTEYFNTVMIAYVLSLIFTVLVMYVFNAAQPALLYLVPGCLGSTLGLAYYHGKNEFDLVLNYTDNPEVSALSPLNEQIIQRKKLQKDIDMNDDADASPVDSLVDSIADKIGQKPSLDSTPASIPSVGDVNTKED